MKRGTTTGTAGQWITKSQQVFRSQKTRKAPGRVFGPSSQFAGVGLGKPGDPRK